MFHHAIKGGWKPTVRPPRLGGNEKVGVFASRSPFRPNPIGLSCVRLEEIDHHHPAAPVLKLRGVDLVDGTPILDIKPYIPYADALPGATGGFAQTPPPKLEVRWQTPAPNNLTPATKTLIEKTLSTDPRPAYQRNTPNREYGCLINNHNVRWKVAGNHILITSCTPVMPDY